MRNWIASATVVSLAIVVNLNLLSNGFVYDDSFILQSRWIHELGHIPDAFSHSIWGHFGAGSVPYYRPLMTILVILCWNLFGLHFWGYHLVSILLHAACSLLVFVVGKEIACNERAALWAALLFAVHPVHTEPVGWFSSNMEVAF